MCDGPLRDSCVMVIDDDADVRLLLAEQLQRMGASVEAVATRAAALGALRTTAYDAVVVDFHLTDGTGAEAAAELRAAGFAGRVVMLTGRDVAEVESEVREAGADALLRKPANAEALVGALLGRRVVGDDSQETRLPAAMVARYRQQLPTVCREIEGLIAAGDNAAAARIAHRISGTAASFGFADVGRAAAELERELLAGGAAPIDAFGRAVAAASDEG
ncbi:MAG: response regulator [Planctomycetota bacterium]